MHISGLHLHVFLSPNLNFYACRSNMLNVALFAVYKVVAKQIQKKTIKT